MKEENIEMKVKSIDSWVEVKFLCSAEVTIQEADGIPEKRTFSRGEVCEIPREAALLLFKKGRVLPGLQYGKGGFVEKIYE